MPSNLQVLMTEDDLAAPSALTRRGAAGKRNLLTALAKGRACASHPAGGSGGRSSYNKVKPAIEQPGFTARRVSKLDKHPPPIPTSVFDLANTPIPRRKKAG